MTPEQTAFEAAREWVGTAIMGVLGWLGLDIVRKFRLHGKRINALELDHVSRSEIKDEFDETRASFTASLQNEHTQIIAAIDKRFEDLTETQRLILDKLIPGRG